MDKDKRPTSCVTELRYKIVIVKAGNLARASGLELLLYYILMLQSYKNTLSGEGLTLTTSCGISCREMNAFRHTEISESDLQKSRLDIPKFIK